LQITTGFRIPYLTFQNQNKLHFQKYCWKYNQIKFENMIHLRLAHFETNWDKKIGNLPAFYRVYFWSVVKCFIRYFIVTESSEYTNTHFKLIFIRCHNQ